MFVVRGVFIYRSFRRKIYTPTARNRILTIKIMVETTLIFFILCHTISKNKNILYNSFNHALNLLLIIRLSGIFIVSRCSPDRPFWRPDYSLNILKKSCNFIFNITKRQIDGWSNYNCNTSTCFTI